MKTRTKMIRFPALGDYHFYIVATTDVKKYVSENSKFQEVSTTGDDENTYAINIHNEGNAETYIIFPFKASLGSIAHECWHAVRRMLLYLDAELDNEVVAYHLGYLVDKAWDVVWGKK